MHTASVCAHLIYLIHEFKSLVLLVVMILARILQKPTNKSQQIRILHKTNKNKHFFVNCCLLESMLIYCICTQYLIGAPFVLITASIRRGMEVISLWHCCGGMEAQVPLHGNSNCVP